MANRRGKDHSATPPGSASLGRERAKSLDNEPEAGGSEAGLDRDLPDLDVSEEAASSSAAKATAAILKAKSAASSDPDAGTTAHSNELAGGSINLDDDLDDSSGDDPDDAEEVESLSEDEWVEEEVPADVVEAPISEDLPFGFKRAANRVKSFPTTPGVYLMKDLAGRVIYVGKAKNLRNRASSYFHKAAAEEMRTATWVHEICDIDFVACETEVDALLTESRLIKDIQPKHNKELKDDKTFPYLMITTHEEFPRVIVTRTPRDRGVKLYGPFTSAGALRGAVQVMQRIFKFRTCSLDINEQDPQWRWFRPCLLASIRQCTAPCNLRISKEEYRKDIRRLQTFLEGGREKLLKQMREEMTAASKELNFEKAARLRDEILMLEKLDQRGEIDTHTQPEVFQIDPKKGLVGLRKILKLSKTPRIIEGVDIAHLGGQETVASLVQFIDGLPFKPGYRRYQIQNVKGVDDFRSIHEVVSRRFRRLADQQETFPDILLIDGGKGQLNAALAAFRDQQIEPPTLLSLAKREEEIFLPGQSEPIRLSRHAFALRLLQYVRDEAHRFAQHYHHILRRKSHFDR